MKNKPAYGIQSVDHALHLAVMLQQEGPLRLSEAARRLGVARSTAHRLLTMLVYRDFAAQDEDRRYVAGPVLGQAGSAEPVAELRQIAWAHLHALTAKLNETTNLVVVVGDQVRFLASIECAQTLRVGDREGRVLPAHLASGGRAVLATRPEDKIRELYSGPESPVADVEALMRELRRIRRQGFALNNQQTETGVTAIGCAVPGHPGADSAAISVAMPTARYHRSRLTEWAGSLRATAQHITRDLGEASPSSPAR